MGPTLCTPFEALLDINHYKQLLDLIEKHYSGKAWKFFAEKDDDSKLTNDFISKHKSTYMVSKFPLAQ
jgi:hypothetical protein